MKRKFFALALMLLVLTGCSSNNTDKTKATEPMMAVTEPKAELGAVITAPVTKAPAADMPFNDPMLPQQWHHAVAYVGVDQRTMLLQLLFICTITHPEPECCAA